MNYLYLSDWSNKIYSTPEIPRKNNFVDSLYIYLKQFKAENLEEKMALKLRTNGFLFIDEKNNWQLTRVSKNLLKNEDTKILFKHLSDTIVFFGEILYLLNQSNMNVERLLKIANEKYLIVNWKRKSQILTRLQWLKDLELVHYSEFENLYKISDKGQVYLELIISDFKSFTDNEVNPDEHEEIINSIPDWIFGIENKDIDNLGYIAGGKVNYLNTIKETIRLIKNGKNDISDFTESSVFKDLKQNSIKHHIKTLTDMRLLERQSVTTYKVTDIADKILSLNDFQFIFYLDRTYTFVLEILLYLNRMPQTLKDLTAIPKEKYSIDKVNINKRVNFLEAAQLIYKVDYYTYTTSDLGKAILSFLNIESTLVEDKVESYENATNTDSPSSTNSIDSLIIELRQAASDSTSPSRFEKVINECFINLGYDSSWLGKPGETDVLAQTKASPSSQYKIIIDAKSTSASTVSDSLIDFVTLKEHKEKYNADYIVIVGINFSQKRVIKRAVEHEVALLDVDTLAKLLKKHIEVPLGYKEYEKLFSKGGVVNQDSLAEDRDRLLYQKKLMFSVLNVLIKERDDPITKGELSARDIYIMLKMSDVLSQAPTLNQIKEALDFLSSPFISGIKETKNIYSATGAVTEISSTLNFLSK